jgi:DNA ligase-1
MIKAKSWNGKDLKGVWECTIKVDGVRALWNADANCWLSRADKPLYNLPPFDGRVDCEVYCGDFKSTIQKVRAKTKDRPISPDQLFSLSPLDERLRLPDLTDPTTDVILTLMRSQVAKGNEGLILRQGDKWIKIKPIETYDVPVLDVIEGAGKHKGRMGYLVTPMGDVGTGFTDEDRELWWRNRYHVTRWAPAKVIEVECMKLTDDGKFRHPRFLHVRIDK